MPERHFTYTEKKILLLLSDGMPHTRDEIIQCCPDPEYTEWDTARMHLFRVNEKLKGTGTTIHCVRLGYKDVYRHVRLLTPDHIA